MSNIILAIISVILFYTGNVAISAWLMAFVLLKWKIESGDEGLYLENIEDYPDKELVTPTKYKFLFKNLEKLSYKGIPKEIYYARIVKFFGFWVYTVCAVIALLISQRAAVIMFFVYVIAIYGMADLVSIFKVQKKSFLARFKKVNIYNFFYLITGAEYPYPRRKGKCKIVSECRKGKRNYVTVKMLDTGEVKRKILFPGNKRQGEDPTYSLYEICKVLYII